MFWGGVDGKGFSMGVRRRTIRRALVAGAAIAHHEGKNPANQQADDWLPPADDESPADDQQQQAQYAPPPADPADQIEHLAQLHALGRVSTRRRVLGGQGAGPRLVNAGRIARTPEEGLR